MNLTQLTSRAIVFLTVALSILPLQAESDFQKLKDAFAKKQLDIAQPAQTLETKYREHLGNFRGRFQENGNLQAVIAIDQELKTPGEGAAIAEHSELVPFQQAFVKQRKKLDEDAMKQLAELTNYYRTNLQKLQVKLTRAGDIDAAKEVLAESERTANLLQQWKTAATPAASGKPQVIEASHVLNQLEEGDTGRTTYIIESDGTKGVLHLQFQHPLLGNEAYVVREAILELKVADTRAADTHETIAVSLNDKSVGSTEGAEKGAWLSIPLKGEQLRESPLAFVVTCGTNAVVLEKNEESPPRLKLTFGRK